MGADCQSKWPDREQLVSETSGKGNPRLICRTRRQLSMLKNHINPRYPAYRPKSKLQKYGFPLTPRPSVADSTA